MDELPRRMDFGRGDVKRVVERKQHLPVLGSCEDYLKNGRRCGLDARYRYRGRLLCGRHHRPFMVHEAALEEDSRRYRDHQAVNYQVEMMRYPEDRLREIAAAHAIGTVPADAPIYERLRSEARGLAAERELKRRHDDGDV